MTQKQALLKAFKSGHTLTWVSAFMTVGTSKLATRVSELQREGYEFDKEKIIFKTKYGTQGYYYTYKLKQK